MTEIHVARNNQEVGVFDPAGLHLALREGEVLPTDLAWVPGKTNWIPVSELPDEVLEIPDDEPLIPLEMLGPREYYCVPTWRFVICAFATGGLYSLWWMLQNWHYIRQRDQSDIWPFFRMLFSPIWIFPLAADILRQTGERRPGSHVAIGVLYLALRLCEALPEPWWVFACFSFLPLVPLVRRIEARNVQLMGAPIPQRLLYGRHFLICIPLFTLLLLDVSIRLQVTSGFGLLTGAEIKDRNMAWYQQQNLVRINEAIRFVYSGTLVPLRSRGMILTSERLIRYESTDDGLRVESTSLNELQRLIVPEPGMFQPQQIEIATERGNITVTVGHDIVRNRKFIRALENSLPKKEKEDQLQQPDADDTDAGPASTDQ